MRRLDMRPVEARFDDETAFTFRPVTLPDLIEIARGTKMETLIDGGATELKFRPAEAIEIALRTIDTLAISWTITDHDGRPLPVTRAAAAQLVTEENGILEWLFSDVLVPAVERFMLVKQEKNVSTPSQTGATAGAKDTARNARKPAKPVPRG